MSPLSSRDRELVQMAPIESHFPIRYRNKNTWTELRGCCNGCGREIASSALRGMVSHPTERVAIVDAVGVCDECKLLTRFFYRLHDDMRVSTIRDGKWVAFRAKPSVMDRVRDALKFLAFGPPQ